MSLYNLAGEEVKFYRGSSPLFCLGVILRVLNLQHGRVTQSQSQALLYFQGEGVAAWLLGQHVSMGAGPLLSGCVKAQG